MKRNRFFRALTAVALGLAAAVLLPASAQESQGIHISTSTSYDYARHQGTITVETFVEGKVEVVRKATPLDIVMVLDVSGSMSDAMHGEKFISYDDFDHSKPSGYYERHVWLGLYNGGYVTKLGRMMDAAYSFIASIESNAKALGLDHRVGIVTFDSDATLVRDLTSVVGALPSFQADIYGFRAGGSTASDEGLQLAAEMFGRNGESEGREAARAVLMFTDGEPTKLLLFEEKVANDAIAMAGLLKNDLGCRVYAVGMFEGSVGAKVTQYMNAVSSNYPLASDIDHLGAGSDEGYYISVGEGDLSAVFDGISEDIIVGGAHVDLSETAQIRDYMPPFMQLPHDTSVDDIHLYTCRCVGCNPETGTFSFSSVREPIDLGPGGISISHDEDGCPIVCVTGFNYKDHWCGPGMTSGRKLIVEIPFELTASDNGEFNPNRHESGLYGPDGQSVGSFEINTLRFYDLTVICHGLLHGESAVYRLIDETNGRYLCRFAVNADGDTGSGCTAGRTLRYIPEGNYRIIEEGWNWAYTTLPGKTATFVLDGDKTLTFTVSHKSGSDSPLHTEVHRSNR